MSKVFYLEKHFQEMDCRKQRNPPLVVCFGEMLIDFVPTTRGISLAESPAFKKAAGGAPANVAVGNTCLGGLSAFIGKVGEDEFGYMLADILKENNVNNQGMYFDPGAPFVTLRSDGEQPCKSAHIAAAKAAKDAGVVLSYDPNLRLPLWPSADSA